MNPVNTSNPWRVFWLTSAAVFLVSADATILYAAFPAIRQSFPGSTSAHLSWVLNAYTIIFAAVLIVAGRIADAQGHRRVFLIGVGLFTVASAMCGLSTSVAMLIGARILQALGAAMLTPSSLALVLGVFPPERRAMAVALWGAVSALAAAVGPSAGSAIVEYWGWHFAFYINLPVGLVTVLRGAWLLKEQRAANAPGNPDIVGVLLLILGVGLLSLGVVQSEEWGATSRNTVMAVLAGLCILGVFIAWSRRSASPALDLALFANTNFSFANLASFCFGMTFTMMFFGFFLFLTRIWGYSLSLSGLAVTPGPLLVIPVAILTGRVAARAGHRFAIIGGAMVFSAGVAWIAYAVSIQPEYVSVWLPGMLLTGLGVGMVLPSLSAASAHGLPPNRFGVGVAVNTAIRQLGSVFGVALTVLMVGGERVGLPDFQLLYGMLTIGGLLTGLISIPIDTRPAQHSVVAQPAS